MITDKDKEFYAAEWNLQDELTEEESDELVNLIQKLQTDYPDSHTYLNTKVANELPKLTQTDEKGDYINPESVLSVGGRGKGKVDYQIIISADENTPAWMKKLTQFDMAMMYSAITLYMNGNRYITSETVYNEWTNGNRLASKKQGGGTRELVDDSIEKFRTINCDYDYTAEITRKNPDFKGKATAHGHLLELLPIDIESGGHTKRAYKIMEEPAVLTHAKSLGQLITVRKELLCINQIRHKRVWNEDKAAYDIVKELLTSEESITTDRGLIRDYLLKRIHIYKNDTKKKQQNVILFDTMFKELEIINPTQKSRYKDFAITCMDNFVFKHEIKNYKEIKAKGVKGIKGFEFTI